MPHSTIEYTIMVPILILQIFLFPLTANWLMNVWVDSRRSLALQEVADNVGSTIQQMYFSLNHESIQTGRVTQKLDIPILIENHPYSGNVELKTALDPALNSSKILKITLKLKNVGTTATSSVIVGSNFLWQESSFVSDSTDSYITAVKFFDEDRYVIRLAFGG